MASSADPVVNDSPVLRLERFGIRFHERTVLLSVSMAVPSHGCTVLLGPSGTGKSALLRTLAGFNDRHPALQRWGEAAYDGQALTAEHRPALVMQKAQLMVANVLDNLQTGLPDRSSMTRLQQIERISATLREWGQDWVIDQFQVPVVNLTLAQQRIVAILRETLGQPPLLLIDEPTTGVDDAAAAELLALVRRMAQSRAVLIVLHHLGQARQVADQVALLASGRIQEFTPADQFFNAPQSEAGQQFLRTGSCPEEALDPVEDADDASDAIPPEPAAAQPTPPARPNDAGCVAPAADVEAFGSPVNFDLAGLPMAGIAPPPSSVRSAASGPRGFVWLLPGQLAGTPMPGILREDESDLADLQHVGIHRLVSLTEEPYDTARAAPYGIKVVHSPIEDMQAPTVAQAAQLCAALDRWLADGEAVAVHCRAGLGRTGTLLAAYWLWRGHGERSAVESVEVIRRLNHQMIQSQVQVQFLSDFASNLTDVQACRPALDDR